MVPAVRHFPIYSGKGPLTLRSDYSRLSRPTGTVKWEQLIRGQTACSRYNPLHPQRLYVVREIPKEVSSARTLTGVTSA